MSLLGACTGGQVDSGNALISSTVTFTTVVLCSSSNACIVRQKPYFRALKFLCKICSVHAAPNSCWVCTHCTLQLELSVRAAASSCCCQPEHSALQACAHLHVVRFETSSRAALTCRVCRPDSVIIWTRFTPGNSSAVPVTWHMSTSPPEAGGGNSSAEGSVALRSFKGFVEASHAHVSLKCTLRSAYASKGRWCTCHVQVVKVLTAACPGGLDLRTPQTANSAAVHYAWHCVNHSSRPMAQLVLGALTLSY